MFNKLKQFNDLRKQANSLRSRLASEIVTVENKALKITMDGNQEIKEVSVKPEFASGGSKAQLEAAIKDGVNDAVKKAQRIMATKIRESGDFKIPGLS